MKNVAIVYFSGTGNTRVIAELLTSEFTKNGNVDIFRVEDISKNRIGFEQGKYDILGVGTPVHGFDSSRIVYDFVNSLVPAGGKPAFVFCTCAGPFFLNDIALYGLKKVLFSKGYNVFYERQFYMPPNIATPYNDRVSKQLYEAAVRKAAVMAREIGDGRKKLRNDRILPLLMRGLYRVEKSEWKKVSRDFRVTVECDLCMKCVAECPQGNIANKDGSIVFGRDCLACYRCVYVCPTAAIRGKVYDFARIKGGYDIRRVIGDRDIKGDYITDRTRGYYGIFRKYLKDDGAISSRLFTSPSGG